MKKTGKVFVAGSANAARNAIVRRLRARGLRDHQIDTRAEYKLNLCDQLAVRAYLREEMPEQIYITAGPWGNHSDSNERRGTHMADALLGPLQLIHEAMYAGVKKLLLVAAHQVYGNWAVLPIAEEDLTYARPENARAPLAIAHTLGISLCEAYTHEFAEVLGLQYRSVVVGHVFGPGEDSETFALGELQALMRHIHQANLFKLSSVSIRSNGFRRLDWLYVDDMAEACIQVLDMPEREHQALTRPNHYHINLCGGRTHSKLELAEAIAGLVGYKGRLIVESGRIQK